MFNIENRIDIVIGLIYNDYYHHKYNTNYHKKLYIEYKRSWNNLKENGCIGEENFINRFERIIDSIKTLKKNTSPVPLIEYHYNNNVDKWIFDGFHRVSTCMYHNIKLNTTIKEIKHLNMNYPLPKSLWWKHYWYPLNINYFQYKNTQNYSALDPTYINYIMFYYLLNIKKKFSVIISYEGDITEYLNNFHIIFKTKINIPNNNFQKNLIELLYYKDKWPKQCYIQKSEDCFIGKDLIIYFINYENLNFIKNEKTKIRKIFNRQQHSIHSTDNQHESNDLVYLLNMNTINFLSLTPSLFNNFKNFNYLLCKLREYCKKYNLDTNKLCITSSSVLSVYGIRDCRDMDLFIDKEYENNFKNSQFDHHNKYTVDGHYPYHFEDIIYNPNNHFYYKGFKFCNLSIILKYKQYRVDNKLFGDVSIQKDIRDINNINLVNENNDC